MSDRFKILFSFVVIFFTLGCTYFMHVEEKRDNNTSDNFSSKISEQDTLIIRSNISVKNTEPDKSDLLDDNDIYNFIESIKPYNNNDLIDYIISTDWLGGFTELKSNPQTTKPSLQNRYNPPPPIGITFEFPEDDFEYLKNQIHAAENKSWDLEKLGKKKTFIKFQKLFPTEHNIDWDIFYSAGFGSIVTMGLPLFNKGKNIAIIIIKRRCGPLCGGITAFKYELIDGLWVKTDSSILQIN